MKYITAFSFVLLVVLIIFDATNRYLFSNGSTAIQELQWHLFDVVILFSIAFTFRHNSHVRVDILYDKFSKKTQTLIDMVAIVLFVLPLSLLVVYMGFHFTELSFVQNEASSDPGGLPYRWVVKSLMPLAFVFVIFEAVLELRKSFKKWSSL